MAFLSTSRADAGARAPPRELRTVLMTRRRRIISIAGGRFNLQILPAERAAGENLATSAPSLPAVRLGRRHRAGDDGDRVSPHIR